MTGIAPKPLYPHQVLSLEQLPGETWRPVHGYEGVYDVSSYGRVKSCERTISQVNRWGDFKPRQWKARILRQTVDRGPYAYGRLQVKLAGRGADRTRLVHQLVAEAFVGLRPEGMEVAHADGNAQNNRVSNLRYATPAQNSADKHVHGTVLRGEGSPTSKLSSGDVKSILAMRGAIRGSELARMYGVSNAQISRIFSGTRWGHLS